MRRAGGSGARSFRKLRTGFFEETGPYSTVTDFARLRGWSTSVPFAMAV